MSDSRKLNKIKGTGLVYYCVWYVPIILPQTKFETSAQLLDTCDVAGQPHASHPGTDT